MQSPLSLTLFHAGAREKTNPTVSHFFIFSSFLKIGDFIYAKNKAKKIYFYIL